jgi:hypothetical protein
MSLVKDAFDTGFRGRAVAIWAMGASIGGGVALLAGRVRGVANIHM